MKMNDIVIRPLPSSLGCGVFSPIAALPTDLIKGYRYEQIGRFHNYYATPEGWQWPVTYKSYTNLVIDAFSPNLNKFLHVGHLRQLAIARCLQGFWPEPNRFVALFGASLGVLKQCQQDLDQWLHFVNYHPERYYDVLMPQDVGYEFRFPTAQELQANELLPVQERRNIGPDEQGRLPLVWEGPRGLVVVKRGDGTPLYALHDLMFTTEVAPTHYITGHEQKHHFAELGLDNKHLVMGMVLGPDKDNPGHWCKMKSREGHPVLAAEVMEEVQQRLKATAFPKELAWNVLCWNFLHVSRDKDVKFELENWTNPDSPGLYITYTHARVKKALDWYEWLPAWCEQDIDDDIKRGAKYEPIDIELLCLANQHHYWLNESCMRFDPAPLANYMHELAKKLGNAYHLESIRGGRLPFNQANYYANNVLGHCMRLLGMFRIYNV